MTSKAKKDYLFNLIKSLSKAEKRHFKLFFENNRNGEEAIFITLFDVISSMKCYDEKKIMAKMPYLSEHKFRNTKSYLNKQILLSLRFFRIYSEPVLAIKNMIENAAILFDKCLYQQSKKMLKKARRLAEENEQHLLLSEIFYFEKKLIANLIETGMEDITEQVVKDSDRHVTEITKLIDIQNLSLKLYSIYMQKGFMNDFGDLSKIDSFFKDKIATIDPNTLNYTQKYYYYTCLLQYHYFNLNPEQAYHYAYKNHQLFLEKEKLQYAHSEFYIMTFNQLLTAQNRLMLLLKYFETYDVFMALEHNDKILSTKHLKRLFFKYLISHKCNYYFLKGDFKKGTEMIPFLGEQVNKYGKSLSSYHICIFYYKFACMYFGANQFQQAVYWLNNVININNSQVRVDIKSFSRIMVLICHFELGNEDMVEYYIRSTYRFLIKRQHQYVFQKLIIDFLRNTKKKKDLMPALIRLKKEMQKIQNIPEEKRAFQYFDIISWLESRIDNLSIQNVIKRKFEVMLEEQRLNGRK